MGVSKMSAPVISLLTSYFSNFHPDGGSYPVLFFYCPKFTRLKKVYDSNKNTQGQILLIFLFCLNATRTASM